MAIFICKKCNYIKELPNKYLGKVAACPSCQTRNTVLDTLMALSNIILAKKASENETIQLKQQVEKLNAELSTLKNENQCLTSTQSNQSKAKKTESSNQQGYAFANMDDAPELQNIEGVIQWFKQRQIQVNVNQRAIDIAGYFDEVAVLLGDDFSAFSGLLSTINWTFRKGFDKASYPLPDDPEEAKKIKTFCKALYEYAFVTKYIQTKQNKVLLILNKEPKIRNFFNGDWLEWYAFMKVASLFAERNIEFSYLRGFDIVFPNKEKRELDLFFLVDNQPLWIECKTGEFRDSIDKYSKLRKSLNIDDNHAILLISNLEKEKAKSFSHMFDLSIVTETTFLAYIQTLFVK